MSKNLEIKLSSLLETGELFHLVDSVLSASQLLVQLNFPANGRYITSIRNYLISNDVDISHWTTNGAKPLPLEEKTCPVCDNSFYGKGKKFHRKTTCSVSCANTYFRTGKDSGNYVDGRASYRLYAFRQYGIKCSMCGFDREQALEVHHKDKNRKNNSIENLIVLCANCHRLEHSN